MSKISIAAAWDLIQTGSCKWHDTRKSMTRTLLPARLESKHRQASDQGRPFPNLIREDSSEDSGDIVGTAILNAHRMPHTET
eukprot:gene35180-45559_t